ncbi:MAG: hypothetical protein KDE03_07020 [Rhodobacteraceae bacterium]|nr:hypothetical protein [Paracoccaceae bacterium]
MLPEQHKISEDDEFVYVPEALFQHLPSEYREAVQIRKQQGEDVLRIADKDIRGMIRLLNAIPTTASLSYIYHRLRSCKFEATTEAVFEQEVLTTAFIVTYSRLFAGAEGATGIARSSIPRHLRPVHDEIIELRNKRYAHNSAHESVTSDIGVVFDGDGFRISPQMRFGFYVGGRDEWEELIRFIDAHMHERLMKILRRLKERTGYDWIFPIGPAPDWLGEQN